MLNILYVSCHEVLEFDELKVLNSIPEINIRSIGAYARPQSGGPLRGPLPELPYDEKHENLASTFNSNGKNIHPELVEWADVVMFMHMPTWIEINLEALKAANKLVIYRAIGQSVAGTESQLINIKARLGDRFKIIRYSPNERFIKPFAGEDVLIRFNKNHQEFKDWHGKDNFILLCCQAASQRGSFCHIQEALEMTSGLPVVLMGTQNEDLEFQIETINASYEELKDGFRRCKFFFYTGTIPASYTLGFLEAFMTGTPILSLSEQMWRWPHNWVPEGLFEVPNLLGEHNTTLDLESGKQLIRRFYEDEHDREIKGRANRILAHSMFSQEVVKNQWKEFLNAIS